MVHGEVALKVMLSNPNTCGDNCSEGFFFSLLLVYSGLCDAQANGRRLCNFVVYVF